MIRRILRRTRREAVTAIVVWWSPEEGAGEWVALIRGGSCDNWGCDGSDEDDEE